MTTNATGGEDSVNGVNVVAAPEDGYQYGFALSDGDDDEEVQQQHPPRPPPKGGQGKKKGKTDDSSSQDSAVKNPFTSYYAQLLHQQNMLQDGVRTGELKRQTNPF